MGKKSPCKWTHNPKKKKKLSYIEALQTEIATEARSPISRMSEAITRLLGDFSFQNKVDMTGFGKKQNLC